MVNDPTFLQSSMVGWSNYVMGGDDIVNSLDEYIGSDERRKVE